MAYGNGRFVATGGFGAAYSTDGISWTLTTLANSSDWSFVTYGGTPAAQINSISNGQTIIPNRSIAPNVVDEIVGGITLSAGDQVRVLSESPDVIVQVYGVEIV
jgi:hypothetical protein